MNYRIFAIVAFLVSFAAQISYGQISSNSPYTRFGYGELSETTANELRGMGGVSLANRSKNTINSINPASHSSVDSLTFMFDIGVNGRLSQFSDSYNSNKTFNANLDYISMRFPLGKYIGFSAGLLPYSHVGYNFSQADSLKIPNEEEKHVNYIQSFSGNGGISQVYSGLSVELLKHISIGVNAYYLFGETNNLNVQDFLGTSGYSTSVFTNNLRVSDYKFRYGLQLYNTFAKKHDVTLGVIYENKSNLNGEYIAFLNSDTIRSTIGFELPQTLGIGLNYTYNDRLTIGADFTQQKWGDALFFNKRDSLTNTSKIALGIEYINNPYSRNKYSDLIRYRAGFSTSNQYYKLNGQNQPNNLIFTLGAGLPTRTGKSLMNISLEYGHMGSATLLKENYLKMVFSASINEFWFFKPKL